METLQVEFVLRPQREEGLIVLFFRQFVSKIWKYHHISIYFVFRKEGRKHTNVAVRAFSLETLSQKSNMYLCGVDFGIHETLFHTLSKKER